MAKDENKESEIRGDEQEIVDQRLPVWRPQDADREYYRYETKKRIQHYTVPPQTIFRPAKPTPTIRDAEHMTGKRLPSAACWRARRSAAIIRSGTISTTPAA